MMQKLRKRRRSTNLKTLLNFVKFSPSFFKHIIINNIFIMYKFIVLLKKLYTVKIQKSNQKKREIDEICYLNGGLVICIPSWKLGI